MRPSSTAGHFRAVRLIYLFLPLTVLGVAGLPRAARAEDKSFVSEIAKNKPGLTVVYSGPVTLTAARSFANAVMAAKPKQKTAANVLLTPAEKFGGAAGNETTYVYMLIGEELGEAFPPSVKAALPASVQSPASSLSVFTSQITSDRKNAGAFSIVIYAPDAERFARLQQDFSARRFNEDFRAMGRVSRTIKTNKLALFASSELRPTLDGWGVLQGDRTPTMRGAVQTNEVWNTIKTYAPAQRAGMKPEELAGTAEVYFIDRSRPQAGPLPPHARAALAGNTIQPQTIISAKSLTEDGRTVAVFSAPTALLLKGRLNQFPNLEALPDGVLNTDAVDLRRVGATVLLVDGEASPDDRDALRLQLGREMRRELGIVIDEGDPALADAFGNGKALRDLYAGAELLKTAGEETASPYIWTFTLTRYKGTTRYTPTDTSLTTPPPPFDEPQPIAPIKTRNMSEETYSVLMQEYRNEYDDWQREKRNYEDHLAMTDFQWRREVRCDETAEVAGVLRLISLAERGKVLWEHDAVASESHSFMYQNDTIAVQGPNARPSSLPSPPAENTASAEVMRKAALQAGRGALQALGATAWLRDPNAPPPVLLAEAPQPPAAQPGGALPGTEVPDTTLIEVAPTAPAAPPAPAGPKVAAVHGGRAYLNIGSKQGVKVGDRYRVALSVLEITDPDTGAVLDRKVLDSLTLRVITARASAEAVPESAADTAKWARLKIGQTINKLPPRAPAKAPAKPAKAAPRTPAKAARPAQKAR